MGIFDILLDFIGFYRFGRAFESQADILKTLSEGGEVPDHFSRPEVLAILKEYYATLEEKVEIKLHKYARGEK